MSETVKKDKEYYESLDKRTKEYKDWKESQEKLLGDRIEDFTEATGIKKAVETVTKAVGIKDCGCNARKEKINDFHKRIKSMFIHKQPELLTEEEYVFLTEFFAVNRTRVTAEEQRSVFKVYNRVFNAKKEPTMCPSCYKNVVTKLKKLLDLQRK